MRVTFLGTGTSEGVPIIRCHCPVCRDAASRPGHHNRRTRTSIMVEKDGKRLVVDTGPDFREQMLCRHVEQIDGVLYTHSHADHIGGIADLREFSRVPTVPVPTWVRPVPVYGDVKLVAFIREHHDYVERGSRPFCQLHQLNPFAQVFISGFQVTPLVLWHGLQAGFISGYQLGGLLYLTDVKTIPGYPYPDPDYPMPDCPYDTWSYLRSRHFDTMVIDCLEPMHHNGAGSWRASPSHLTIQEVEEMVSLLDVGRVYLIHIDHQLSHQKLSGPFWSARHMYPSYDGLTIEVPNE